MSSFLESGITYYSGNLYLFMHLDDMPMESSNVAASFSLASVDQPPVYPNQKESEHHRKPKSLGWKVVFTDSTHGNCLLMVSKVWLSQ